MGHTPGDKMQATQPSQQTNATYSNPSPPHQANQAKDGQLGNAGGLFSATSYLKVTQGELNAMLVSYKDRTSLESLDLSCCDITEDHLKCVIEYFPHLKSLNLNSANIPENGMEYVAQLKSLTFLECRSINKGKLAEKFSSYPNAFEKDRSAQEYKKLSDIRNSELQKLMLPNFSPLFDMVGQRVGDGHQLTIRIDEKSCSFPDNEKCFTAGLNRSFNLKPDLVVPKGLKDKIIIDLIKHKHRGGV
jgi:hypothetical protein